MADAEIARSHIAAVPPFPDAGRLLVALESPDWARELEREVEGDRSAAEMLRALAGDGTADSTRAAIERLGRRAGVALLLQRLFRHVLMRASERLNDLGPPLAVLRHSLAVGLLAERAALKRALPGVEPLPALLAGALHDLGKLVLAAVYPKTYERYLSRRREADDLSSLESRHLAVDHCIAGGWIAESWSLPAPVRDAIRFHHYSGDLSIPSAEHHELVAIVRAANAVIRDSENGRGQSTRHEEIDALCGAAMLSRVELARSAYELEGDIAVWVRALGFADSPAPATLSRWARDAAERNARRVLELESHLAAARAGEELSAAIVLFEQRINVRGGLNAIVALVFDVAQRLWRTAARAAIGWSGEVIAIASRDATGKLSSFVLPRNAEWTDWIRSLQAAGTRDAVGKDLLRSAGIGVEPSETVRLLPIRRADRPLGAILLSAPSASAISPAVDGAQASALLERYATALADVAAYVQSQRLADDLSETNRRLQRAQGEILRSRALSMIAELAAGAGHELNNPLSVISGRAELLLRDLDPASEAHRSLSQIQLKAHECSRIVSQLMDFAIPRAPQFTPRTASQIFEAIRLPWRARTIPPGVRIEFNLEPAAAHSDGIARVDAEQVAAAVGELIQNALDAVHDRPGPIQVGLRLVSSADASTRAPPERPAAGGLEIVVIDKGCGMSASVLQRAFDPFFSHRVAGRSRGLGLPRAYRLVESHGGRIWLDSRPGEGTRAFIEIPMIA